MCERILSSRRALVAGLLLAPILGCEPRKRDSGIILVGSSATGIPFSFVDPWTNELTGSLVDSARAVAVKTDLKIELRTVPFAALIPSLLTNKIDMIAAALLRTPEREKRVAFSDPVFQYSGALVAQQRDPRTYSNLGSLREMRVGVQVGTRFVEQANEAGIKQVVTYDNISDMLRDLAHGRVDVVYGDEPILVYQLRTGTRPTLRLVRGFTSPSREDLCFVFRRGDVLIPRVNAAIADLRATQFPQILRHWGLQ